MPGLVLICASWTQKIFGRCLFINSENILRFLMGRGKKWFSFSAREHFNWAKQVKSNVSKTRVFELFGGHCNDF